MKSLIGKASIGQSAFRRTAWLVLLLLALLSGCATRGDGHSRDPLEGDRKSVV